MPQIYKTPFTKTLFEKTIDDIVPPSDLAEYINLGANVYRYKFHDGNFDHIFLDRVDEHTKRMVLYAEYLPLSKKDKADLIRTIWIHDIPEIIDSQINKSDVTSTDKIRYPHLNFAVKERENAVMDKIFSLEDKLLYKAFEPAKEMLFTGVIDFDKTTPVGMLGRVIDNFVDGTNSFQGFVTDYLKGNDYRSSLPLPGKEEFHYCFQKGIDAYHHISIIEHPDYQEVRKIILGILRHDFFGFIEEVWTPLAVARLPEYAAIEYEKYQQKAKKPPF